MGVNIPNDWSELKNGESALVKTADYTVRPQDTEIYCDTSGGALTLTLPHLSEAKGKIYTFALLTGGNNMALAVPSNDAVNYAAIEAYDLDATNDRITLLATEKYWIILDAVQA